MSRREKEGEPDAMEHLSASAQCVVIISKIQAIFPTRASVTHTAAVKVYFRKAFSRCKASTLEFKVSIPSINKEISKLYDA